MPAMLVLNDDLTRFPVVVINRSASGLTIELAKPVDLPATFRILVQHAIEPCALAWQNGNLAGVRFCSPTEAF
jgi:hypothetical protein